MRNYPEITAGDRWPTQWIENSLILLLGGTNSRDRDGNAGDE